jgi:hypothetical protein
VRKNILKGKMERESIHFSKVTLQCPLVLPVEVNFRDRKTVGNDVRKVLGSGVCFEMESVSKNKVILLPTVKLPTVMRPGTNLELMNRFVSLSDNCVLLMWGSLSDERTCSLQLPLSLTNVVILGSESRWTHDYILLS